MRNKLPIILNVMFYFILILLMIGCSKSSFSSSQEIQQLLDHYPGLNQTLIYLKVINYENGNITLDVIDADMEFAKILMKKALKEIDGDKLAKILQDIEKRLKRHQGVNQVIFTASCLNAYEEWDKKDKFLEKASDQEKESFYQELIKKYPDSLTRPYRNLSYLAGKRNATALQENYLKKALEVNPNQAEVINELCWFYYTQGTNLHWAKERMEQVIKLIPNYAHGYNTHGAILLKMGEPVKAITYLEHGLKLRQKHDEEFIASDHYLLAISYARSGNITAAQEALDKAKKLNPNDGFRKEAEETVSQK